MHWRGRTVSGTRARPDFQTAGSPIAKAAELSTEPILSPSAAAPGADACGACGAALAPDQRYCLECGERRPAVSDFLRAGPRSSQPAATTPPSVPPTLTAEARKGSGGNPWLPVIAGVGVLLLAMGVGVLIGRSGSSGSKAAPAQVITISGVAGSSTAGTSATSGETFTGDWPAGKKGFTVQLQTLPEGTTPAAVAQAKTAASSKGASAVGALEESSYSSLTGSGYLIYSGDYHTRAEAQKALGTLKSKFPGAKVVEVSNSSSSAAESSGGGSSSSGSSLSHPAPASVLKSLSHAKGKSYEEKSKNLPDVVETG